MKPYNGNPFEEIAKALNDGEQQIVLSREQAAKLIEIQNDIVEAKNELVRQGWGGKQKSIEILTDENRTSGPI